MSDDWEGRHHDHSTEVDPSWAVAQRDGPRPVEASAVLRDPASTGRTLPSPHDRVAEGGVVTDTVQQLAADLTREAQETGLNWVQELADRATALAGERRGDMPTCAAARHHPVETYPAREFGQVHVMKIDGGWYGRLCEGAKTHEVRRHDRDFQVGDLLRFRIVGDGPSSPLAPRDWLITHVLPLSHVPEANFSASWCVLSLREVPGDE